MFWRKIGLSIGMVGCLWIWMDSGIGLRASGEGMRDSSYFITEWLVVGPFPNEWGEDYIDFLGGETEIAPEEGRTHWSELAQAEGPEAGGILCADLSVGDR